MRDNRLDDSSFAETYHLKDGDHWNTTREREKLRDNQNWRNQFYRFAYRPFDTRWIYYQPNLIARGDARVEMMRHFFEENMGMISARNTRSPVANHFYCCDTLVEMKCGESTIQSYVFPLYVYGEKDKSKKRFFGSAMMLFEPEAEYGAKKTNLSAEVIERLIKP